MFCVDQARITTRHDHGVDLLALRPITTRALLEDDCHPATNCQTFRLDISITVLCEPSVVWDNGSHGFRLSSMSHCQMKPGRQSCPEWILWRVGNAILRLLVCRAYGFRENFKNLQRYQETRDSMSIMTTHPTADRNYISRIRRESAPHDPHKSLDSQNRDHETGTRIKVCDRNLQGSILRFSIIAGAGSTVWTAGSDAHRPCHPSSESMVRNPKAQKPQTFSSPRRGVIVSACHDQYTGTCIRHGTKYIVWCCHC